MTHFSLRRKYPNVLITGTPGVGKTSLCTVLSEETPIKHLNINEIIINNKLSSGKDEKRDCLIVDDDKLIDHIEDNLKNGGYLIDTHLSDVVDIKYIDLVIVLRCNNTILYDRLKDR